MIVCLNKEDNSVCFVIHEPSEIDNYIFLPDEMELIEMEPLPNRFSTFDYVEYFVIDGKWVHFYDIYPES